MGNSVAKHRWPSRLWIVRHGQSAGNVARDLADEQGLADINIDARDVDVPLSDLGHRQSQALGRWFAALPENERPNVVLTSPYRRARSTADAVHTEAGLAADFDDFIHDERLREKEFGILDRLTRVGIEQKYPEQAAARSSLGKFYHRPPGGESWCDVILRLRSVVDTISIHHTDQRVLIVAHQVVVLCLRYLLENMDEKQILAIDAEGDVANCAVTDYAATDDGRLRLMRYNFVAPMLEEGETITDTPDLSVARR
jgi:broad specificity phosphatase PhoE